MRILIVVIFVCLFACRSETVVRNLDVTTEAEIKLPPDAIFGNLSSFSGFHATVPDLFIAESIKDEKGTPIRKLILSDQTVIVDKLLEVNGEDRSIRYKTIQTSLAVSEMTHMIMVKALSDQKSKVIWTSNISVQNQYRDYINDKISGMQEAYLFSLELLGEELDELLSDPDF